MMQQHLILMLHAGELAAWHADVGSAPRSLPLQGQERLPISSTDALAAACNDVIERLHGEAIAPALVHCLADEGGRQLWCQLWGQNRIELPQRTPWQLLAWEWLAPRWGWDSHWPAHTIGPMLEQTIVPWLLTQDDAAERHNLYMARTHEHASATERLAAERAALTRDNEHLRAQNAALQQVDAENLLRFLPALYPRVFTELGAVELALLCGRVEPLNIPNPYPEPPEATLRTLQKDFRALPPPIQKQITGLIARLPQRQKLQPRPEMRALIQQLEE